MQVLVTQLAAKQSGYADVVYLDAKTDTYLEEVSSCNIFTVKGKTVKTPPLQARDLPSQHISPRIEHCLSVSLASQGPAAPLESVLCCCGD